MYIATWLVLWGLQSCDGNSSSFIFSHCIIRTLWIVILLCQLYFQLSLWNKLYFLTSRSNLLVTCVCGLNDEDRTWVLCIIDCHSIFVINHCQHQSQHSSVIKTTCELFIYCSLKNEYRTLTGFSLLKNLNKRGTIDVAVDVGHTIAIRPRVPFAV